MAWKKTRWILYGPGVLVALAALIQLVPVARTNPPVTHDLDAPPQVKAILKASCYDCHSNETLWPWYSHVAPVSWLVASDVARGRHHFNFSTWDRYDTSRRHAIVTRGLKEIHRGDMPPWYYTIKHPDGKMTDQKRAALESWAATF
jgi:hypothetical protein